MRVIAQFMDEYKTSAFLGGCRSVSNRTDITGSYSSSLNKGDHDRGGVWIFDLN